MANDLITIDVFRLESSKNSLLILEANEHIKYKYDGWSKSSNLAHTQTLMHQSTRSMSTHMLVKPVSGANAPSSMISIKLLVSLNSWSDPPRLARLALGTVKIRLLLIDRLVIPASDGETSERRLEARFSVPTEAPSNILSGTSSKGLFGIYRCVTLLLLGEEPNSRLTVLILLLCRSLTRKDDNAERLSFFNHQETRTICHLSLKRKVMHVHWRTQNSLN